MTQPSVFISYSHKDEIWKDRLVTHLGVLEQEGLLDLWDDRRIGAGEDWEREIQKAMAKASVAVLLISADYLNSKFILGEEVPTLMERREKEGIHIFPIIIRPCAWKHVKWLARMNVRPKDGKPISGGNESQIDTDLTAIAEEIAGIIESASHKVQPALSEEISMTDQSTVKKDIEAAEGEPPSNGFRNGYALIIGIANYPGVNKLPGTILKDARDIHDLLLSPAHCGYLQANIRLLLDEGAKAEGIRQGLRWLAGSAGPADTALLYFSGHGGRVETGAEQGNYLIPYDADPKNLGATAISDKELTDLLKNIRSQRFLVLFDSCYSGGTGDVKGLAPEMEFKSGFREEYYDRLTKGAGRVIMASSRTDEVSLVLPGMENSLFTHYMLEALRGNARTGGDGLIRVFNIFEYVSEKVPARGSQHPIFKASDLENNFPVALYLGGKKVSVLPPQTSVNKTVLREAIVKQFSLEELEILCADIQQTMLDDGQDLQVDLEIVGGTGKAAKVLKLIEYLDRRGFLAYLVNAVRRSRSGII